MSLLADIAAGLFIVAGTAFFLIGAIGILRMPDLFTRLHATSLAETTGMVLVVIGLALHAGFSFAAAKLLVLLAVLLVMGPASTHALAAAARAAGIKPLAEGGTATPRRAAPQREAPRPRKGRA